MNKKIMIITMLAMILTGIFTTIAFAEEAQNINIYVNEEQVEFDVEPFINSDSRTMSPLRFVTEAMGYEVSWNQEKFQVTITGTHNDSVTELEVILPIGVNYAYVNGDKMYFDTNTIIVNSRTFVPLRFISEVFGATVGYEYGRDFRNDGEFAHIIDVDSENNVEEVETIKFYFKDEITFSDDFKADFGQTITTSDRITDYVSSSVYSFTTGSIQDAQWRIYPQTETQTYDIHLLYMNLDTNGITRLSEVISNFPISDSDKLTLIEIANDIKIVVNQKPVYKDIDILLDGTTAKLVIKVQK